MEWRVTKLSISILWEDTMRKIANPKELVSHPKNDYFFDKMEESKWGDFKESIAKNGLFEAPIVTPENLVVSGHERIRACIELGVDVIEVEEREFKDDDAILTCLIETNIQQRGSIGGSVIKMARRIQALERCYGIRHGNNAWGGQEIISAHKTQEQLAEDLNMSTRNLRIIRNLADLPVEFQNMVDNGKITPTAAAKLIVGLTSQEKDELLEYLSENDDSVKRFTETQISQYIEAIQTCETKIKDFQELSSGNNDDYLRIVEEKERMKAEAMRSLSELTLSQRELKEAKKELAEAKKRGSLYDNVKAQLEQTQSELSRLKENGTTVAQITHSLMGVLSVVSGVAESEMAGNATKKESDKINDLVEKISTCLNSIGCMVNGEQMGQSA
jgi:ParB-like chromosome segregation protein Spo0J